MSVSRFVESHLATLAAGTALALGIYVLYGPNQQRKKGRKTEVRGLINSGNSCFVNAVIQALASCPSLYYWLQGCVSKKDNRTLRGSLYEVLGVMNNLSSQSASDPYSPALLLASLRSHGWVINTEEQDAHEMLNIIMTTLEEELVARKTETRPSHASLLDLSNIGLDSDGSDVSSDEENYGDMEHEDPRSLSSLRSPLRRGMSLPPESRSRSQEPSVTHRGCISRETSPANSRFPKRKRCDSGVYIKGGEEIPTSVVSNITKPKCQTPFTGLLTSKLSYSNGKSHSPVHYSTFNNITLNLPGGGLGAVTLDTLLQMFVSQERVENCDRNGQDNFMKQLTFGKLPDCLCFHIQRTGFAGGQPYKRHDYVEFPVLLNMDRFTHTSQLTKSRSINTLMSVSSGPSSLPSQQAFIHQSLYQLRAVVVHTGGINSGHYITYRKGPLATKNSSKWYYTSDSLIKQVPFSEVSRAPAYMIFYERDLGDKDES